MTVATTSRTATAESRQVSWTTTVNAAVEEVTWAGEDTVTYSSIDGETCDPNCTPICSETTESSTATGQEDTKMYAPSVVISAKNADCKRGAQFPSPASVTSAVQVELTHAGTVTERGYSVESVSGAIHAGEQGKGGRGHG